MRVNKNEYLSSKIQEKIELRRLQVDNIKSIKNAYFKAKEEGNLKKINKNRDTLKEIYDNKVKEKPYYYKKKKFKNYDFDFEEFYDNNNYKIIVNNLTLNNKIIEISKIDIPTFDDQNFPPLK